MKIVCDACGAKYSIADEKVQGKVFKIRCKRCSNIIVVRGDSDAAASAPAEAGAEQGNFDQKETRVFDYSGYDNPSEAAAAGDDAIWHVVIDQEQIGPLTAAEIASKFGAQEIDADSYIWQEGFADWERLADVAEFASLAAGGEGGGLFGGPPVEESATAQSDPADLFAAAAGEDQADPGADLFAGGAAGAAAADAGGGLFDGLPTEAEAEPAESKLKGERNENSVLFSLSNLASLASGDAAAPSSSSSAAAPAAAPGSRTTATQEGSGLIDIRSMAQVYLGDEGGAKPAASAGTGSVDDLPNFGATSFGAGASPMLLPTAPAADDNKKLLYALVGVIGVLALAAIILVVMVVSGGDETVASATGDETDGTEATGAAGEGTGDEAPTAGKKAEPGETEPAAGTETKPTEAETKPSEEPKDTKTEVATATKKPERKSRSSSSSSGSSRPRSTSTSTKKSTSSSSSSKPKETATSSAGCDEVTCLVEPNKACCRKYRSSGSSRKSGGSSNLKERPTKSDVRSGISKVMGRVRSCGSKHGGSGVVKVRVKVSKNGRVSSASPSPGNALGKCVASAVKRARFPKTQKGVTFTYPFRF